jgi:hypothetical protein
MVRVSRDELSMPSKPAERVLRNDDSGPRPWPRMARHLAPRPRQYTLRADEAEAQATDQFGTWPHARLLRMDGRFKAAMAKAPERPTSDGPDRVTKSLLPPRRS